MGARRETIASNTHLSELANTIALQANALADLDPNDNSYYSRVRLIAENIDTLKAWTADRKPMPVTQNRRLAEQTVATVEGQDR